jgi:ribosomal protein S18 acetylase RimI-like enzyme
VVVREIEIHALLIRVIRPATPDDERALRALDRATWSSLSSPVPKPPPERMFETEGVLVSELEDGIAGYVKVGQMLPIDANAHVLEIKGIAVSPAHRRRGVGRALMRAAIEFAREAGARKLMLRVLSHNTAARDLYAGCGFEVEAVLREFFLLDGRYVDDILMSMSFGSPASR